MSGFIRSVFSGFAASMLANGALRAVEKSAANKAAPSMPPVQYTPAPVVSTGENIYEQRVFGTPGASLYTANNLGVDARQAGIDGETRVATELERLANLYPNTYIFHSVKLPGKLGDIDHLVIQGDRMLLVDTKNWKHDAAYHIYHSTFEADYISRDGEQFLGGEIHLTRQIAEWQVEFMDSTFDVQGVLVIANRKSTVSENINAPYSIANISGLATIFNNLFNEAGAEPLHPLMVNRIMSMVQSVNVSAPVTYQPDSVQQMSKKPATTKTKRLVAWSIFNYTVMMLLFPLGGISALPLLFVTHRYKAYVKENNLGGGGLLTAVLVFTYIFLFGWALVIWILVIEGMKRGVFPW